LSFSFSLVPAVVPRASLRFRADICVGIRGGAILSFVV
jgi:hypothetical protein